MNSDHSKEYKVMLNYFSKGCVKLFFISVPNIDSIYMKTSMAEIFSFIKMEKFSDAKELILKLKSNLPMSKLVLYFTKLSKFLTREHVVNIPDLAKVSGALYIEEMFTEVLTDLLNTVNYKNFIKFLELANDVDNIESAAYETLLLFLTYFKNLKDKEPLPLKKIREEIEYVFLIQMYLNGSKELPERKSDNFNYSLLSEFLKKDDLIVLKSLENYIDSAETKTMGAAGAVAQSIEKEDVEPGVKKKKKDIKRIEELE